MFFLLSFLSSYMSSSDNDDKSFIILLLSIFHIKKKRMTDGVSLLENLDKLHTTELGAVRIRRNLAIDQTDVVRFCKDKIMDERCKISRKGKNWYCEVDNIIITVNAHNFTIITAHII